MLPAMKGILEKNASETGEVQDIILRVAAILQPLFPGSDGRGLKSGRKRLDFMHWSKSNDIIGIRKGDWKEDMLIMIGTDNKGVFMGLRQTRDKGYKDNDITNALGDRWNGLSDPISANDMLTKSQTFAFGAYLPQKLRHWTKGDYFTPDFWYALDAEQEKQALEVVEDDVKRFVTLNEDIYAWASGK